MIARIALDPKQRSFNLHNLVILLLAVTISTVLCVLILMLVCYAFGISISATVLLCVGLAIAASNGVTLAIMMTAR
jgi:hypothetical protein